MYPSQGGVAPSLDAATPELTEGEAGEEATTEAPAETEAEAQSEPTEGEGEATQESEGAWEEEGTVAE